MRILLAGASVAVLAMLGGCAIERAIAVEECTDFYEHTPRPADERGSDQGGLHLRGRARGGGADADRQRAAPAERPRFPTSAATFPIACGQWRLGDRQSPRAKAPGAPPRAA